MEKLSSRERMLRVFRREATDRVPIRLWGVDPMFPPTRPSYAPLYELVERHELDLIRNWRPSADEADPPVCQVETERREVGRDDRYENVQTLHTPAGPLTAATTVFIDGRPGYAKEHFVKSIDDAKTWMSIPFREPQFKTDSYAELAERTGDRAVIMIGLDHSMYHVQRLMGSKTFGFWLIDERELLHEMISHSFRQVEATVKRYLAHGVGDCFGWVGPELCIPPLTSPRDFDEFVAGYDRRIIDLIHDAGKLVWVHSHGDMGLVLEGFADMGVDCLNPMEPPPIGSLTLAEAKERVGHRMTLEGGVENGDFDCLPPDQLAPVVEEAMHQGKPGGGYILCPTSGPSTWPVLNERHVENYRVFVETGLRLASYE